MSSKPAWLVGAVLKRCGVPMADCIAQMLCKQAAPDTPIEPDTPEPTGYTHDSATQTLTINDASELAIVFVWDTMRMDVIAK